MRFARLLLIAALAARAGALEAPAVDTRFQSVVVRPGDTLWAVSRKYLKDPARWDQILKYNRLPTADPTVALPGMTLRVPVGLIKASLRAAHLTYSVNRVLARRKDKAEWKDAAAGAELYQNDTLRTLEDSKARVMMLDKELLSLEPNSMAVIKPAEDDADVVLKVGSLFAGHAKVVTETARVTPRTGDTRYSARVDADLTTRVSVFSGAAAVEAQGAEVVVPAGMATRVSPGLAPEAPAPAQDLPELELRAQEFASAKSVGGGAAPDPKPAPPQPEPEADAESLRSDIQVLRVGQPIKGFHIQAARTRDFLKLVFDRQYDADERFSAAEAGLPPGAYWWRVAAVDLLGVEGPYHAPHYYSLGLKRDDSADNERLSSMVSILTPENNAEVGGDTVRVTGVLRDDRLKVEINGTPVTPDDDGNFTIVLKIRFGGNTIAIDVSDAKGNKSRMTRHVVKL